MPPRLSSGTHTSASHLPPDGGYQGQGQAPRPRELPAASDNFKDPVISFYFEQKKASCGNKQTRPPPALAGLPLAWVHGAAAVLVARKTHP